MLPALIHPNHLYGFRSDVRDNLAYVDERTLLYLAGSVGCMHDTDQHTQRFIPNVARRQSAVHAMRLSPNHQFMAVAERSRQVAHLGICIYDLLTLKKLTTLGATKFQQQLQQQQQQQMEPDSRLCIISMAFSHDSKYLVAIGGAVEWTVVYWDRETGKVLSTISLGGLPHVTAFHQIVFHSHDDTQLSAVGTCGWINLRLEEGNVLRVTGGQRSEGIEYYCMAWVSDSRVLVGGNEGRVYLIEGAEIAHTFTVVRVSADLLGFPNMDSIEEDEEEIEEPETNAVTILVVFTKGFICSCNSNAAYLFERNAGGKVFRQAAVIKVPSEREHAHDATDAILNVITVITLSPSEDVVAVATNDKRIYTFTLTNVDINKGSGYPQFEPLTAALHRGAILDLDVCLRKPIAVTCGSDRVVAVWNLASRQQQLFRQQEEDVLSVSLHPTGLYLLIGFAAKLRLMGLMIDDFRLVHEFTLRECHASAFSHGGHLIAAAQANAIFVYSTITFDVLANFKGHVAKITSICWSYDDLKIVSCGLDGSVYEWDVHLLRRCNEVTVRTCQCQSVAVARDNCTSFAVGSDAVVREIAESQVLGEVTLPGSAALTSVVALHCGKALFTGSQDGTIWVVAVPLTNQEECQEFQPINTDVVKMKLTNDDKWLLAVASDGTFGIWKITDKDGRLLQPEGELPFLEEILITTADLEEKNLALCELTQQVRDIKAQSEQKRRAKECEHNEQVAQMTSQFQDKLVVLTNELESVSSKKLEFEEYHRKVVEEMNSKYCKMVEKLTSETHQKLILEYEKYQELQVANQKQSEVQKSEVERIANEKKMIADELTKQHNLESRRLLLELSKAKDETSETKKKCEDMIRLIEEDADHEILSLKLDYEKKLSSDRETFQKVKADTGILRKKILSLQKEIEEQNEEIKLKNGEHTKLQNSIKELQKDMQTLRKEIDDRDDILLSKEKRTFELKSHNSELEKFKFVLECKVQELCRQMTPKNTQITTLEKQITEYKANLHMVKKSNIDLQFQNNGLRMKINTVSNTARTEEQKVKRMETTLNNMKWELKTCSSQLHDPKKLKQSVALLSMKFDLSSEEIDHKIKLPR